MSSKGLFTDTTLCIGCKACEVACKEWNQLPADGYDFTAMSYDNTVHLGASTWRHVAFVERPAAYTPEQEKSFSWLMLSDVCKHCNLAGCLENCPTGAIIRTEFDTVYVQPDVCNGCGYCVSGCPFGVIDRREDDGRAWKCTMCYDRLKDDQVPACAKACPTESIKFGELEELRQIAGDRVQKLRSAGQDNAYLYGTDMEGTGPLQAFFLLTDRPEVYNLPPEPAAPQKTVGEAWRSAGLGALGLLLAAALVVQSER